MTERGASFPESPQEIVVRVVVEQPGASETAATHPDRLDEVVESVAKIGDAVVKLAEITERLAITDESDEELGRLIRTFDKRITATSRIAKEARDLITDSEAIQAIIEKEVEKQVNERLAEAALLEVKPAVKSEPEGAEEDDESGGEIDIQLGGDEEQVETQQVFESAEAEATETPDYLIVDERLSTNGERAERILLFLLAQPHQRYISPRDTAGKDIRQMLEMDCPAQSFGNTLAHLRRVGVVWQENKNLRRITAIGLEGEALREPSYEECITDRVKEKIERTNFSEDNHQFEASNKSEEVNEELTSSQYNVLMKIGEEEIALTTQDFEGIMNDEFGRNGHLYADDALALIERGFIVKHAYKGLDEYRLTPAGEVYYEKIKEEIKQGKGPPFLTDAQGS